LAPLDVIGLHRLPRLLAVGGVLPLGREGGAGGDVVFERVAAPFRAVVELQPRLRREPRVRIDGEQTGMADRIARPDELVIRERAVFDDRLPVDDGRGTAGEAGGLSRTGAHVALL